MTVEPPARRTVHAAGVVRVAVITCASDMPIATSPRASAAQVCPEQVETATMAKESRRAAAVSTSKFALARAAPTVPSMLPMRSSLDMIGCW
jgi:hypothetical protein